MNWLDVNIGLRLEAVPGIVTFIDRTPADTVAVSHVQEPLELLLHDHDDGDPLPLSKDPFGATLVTVAGSSRYTNPDNTPDDAYSKLPNCKLLTDPPEPKLNLIPSDVTNVPCARTAAGIAPMSTVQKKSARACATLKRCRLRSMDLLPLVSY